MKRAPIFLFLLSLLSLTGLQSPRAHAEEWNTYRESDVGTFGRESDQILLSNPDHPHVRVALPAALFADDGILSRTRVNARENPQVCIDNVTVRRGTRPFEPESEGTVTVAIQNFDSSTGVFWGWAEVQYAGPADFTFLEVSLNADSHPTDCTPPVIVPARTMAMMVPAERPRAVTIIAYPYAARMAPVITSGDPVVEDPSTPGGRAPGDSTVGIPPAPGPGSTDPAPATPSGADQYLTSESDGQDNNAGMGCQLVSIGNGSAATCDVGIWAFGLGLLGLFLRRIRQDKAALCCLAKFCGLDNNPGSYWF